MISDLHTRTSSYLPDRCYDDIEDYTENSIADVRNNEKLYAEDIRKNYNNYNDYYTNLCIFANNRRVNDIFKKIEGNNGEEKKVGKMPLKFRKWKSIKNLGEKTLIFDFCSIFELEKKSYRLEIPAGETFEIPESIRKKYVYGIPEFLPFTSYFSYA